MASLAAAPASRQRMRKQIREQEDTMCYQNPYFFQKMMEQKTSEYLRQAEKDHLLASLNPRRPNPVLQFARNTLHAIKQLASPTARRLNQIKELS